MLVGVTIGNTIEAAADLGGMATALGIFISLPITAIAVVLNFLGFNPMRALVWSGIVQGFSTPPLLLLIMLMTNNRSIMGDKVNSRGMNALGWITTAALFSASAGLVVTWLL